MNDSNSSSGEENKEEQKNTNSSLLKGASYPGTQPSYPMRGENYIEMPSLAEAADMADSKVTFLLCNLPISPVYGEMLETLEDELHPNAMRRLLNTLIVMNDMGKSAFDQISEADSIDELSDCFQAADNINV